MEESDNNYDIRNLILSVLEETSNVKFLEKCYFIYEAQNMEEESKAIIIMLEDDDFLRSIRRLDAMTEETDNKIFYYSPNNMVNSKLHYDKELEEEIRSIRNEQISVLAKLLKKLNEETEIELE